MRKTWFFPSVRCLVVLASVLCLVAAAACGDSRSSPTAPTPVPAPTDAHVRQILHGFRRRLPEFQP
jgi:hypothetical protein